MSTPRSYHHGDLRAALLETTRTVLADVGIEGLSLREVSRQTGVSHAAAYNHFRDKATLMQAVVDTAFDRLAAEMRRSCSRTVEPIEKLKRLGIAYVRFAYRSPAEFKIMFRPELCPRPGTAKTQAHGDAYRLLVEAVLECQAAGAIAPGPPDTIVLAAWSIVHGLASLIVDGPNPRIATTVTAAETLARACLETLATGLRVRAGATTLRRVTPKSG